MLKNTTRVAAIVAGVMIFWNPFVAKADELNIVLGVEHISSIMDGVPFNSKEETSVDLAYLGLRYEWRAWNLEVDVAHGFDADHSELKGSNPRAIFRIEREFRIFRR